MNIFNLFKNNSKPQTIVYGLTVSDYIKQFEQLSFDYRESKNLGKHSVVAEVYSSGRIKLFRGVVFGYGYLKIDYKLEVHGLTMTKEESFVKPLYEYLTNVRIQKEDIEKINISKSIKGCSIQL